MEYEVAKQRVHKFINDRFDSDDELIIEDEGIIETDFGWVFPYDSKKFLESGELIYASVGNAPIIFDNRDESIHITGTAHDVDYYINQHQEYYNPQS
ncbi:hypothetical protein IQ247_13585 [Plectonema cf. radiosum LEGE 06105]|uniref:Immunity protein 35 domain-containing protein n=1 Tax=Plectonema cf. radiosum LEGE 06105 TaxID=945769 RepID=A0A8J7F7V8_9CYAN|nr:YrhB domain-containing protein [Plectonema radiosum]MBE9213684.1 hypothetical protein [Plectonema cf. radiosum LEGE 06105]